MALNERPLPKERRPYGVWHTPRVVKRPSMKGRSRKSGDAKVEAGNLAIDAHPQ